VLISISLWTTRDWEGTAGTKIEAHRWRQQSRSRRLALPGRLARRPRAHFLLRRGAHFRPVGSLRLALRGKVRIFLERFANQFLWPNMSWFSQPIRPLWMDHPTGRHTQTLALGVWAKGQSAQSGSAPFAQQGHHSRQWCCTFSGTHFYNIN